MSLYVPSVAGSVSPVAFGNAVSAAAGGVPISFCTNVAFLKKFYCLLVVMWKYMAKIMLTNKYVG